MWGSDDPTISEGGQAITLGGMPLKVFIAGNNATRLTQDATNAAFVIYADP